MEPCNVIIDVYFRFMAAADKLGVSGDARRDVLAIVVGKMKRPLKSR